MKNCKGWVFLNGGQKFLVHRHDADNFFDILFLGWPPIRGNRWEVRKKFLPHPLVKWPGENHEGEGDQKSHLWNLPIFYYQNISYRCLTTWKKTNNTPKIWIVEHLLEVKRFEFYIHDAYDTALYSVFWS